MVNFIIKELIKMIVANKRTNENNICNEHSINITLTNLYNCIVSEQKDFEY